MSDYRDPVWDGTERQFAEVVVPARMDEVKATLDQVLVDMGFPDLHLEWEPGAVVGYDIKLPTPGPTMAQLEQVVRELGPYRPLVRTLRCHPTVFAALRDASAADTDWPSYAGPSLVNVDVQATTDLPPGQWQLLGADGDVVEQGTVRLMTGDDGDGPRPAG